MAQLYRAANPYKWLGQPATAQNVVPASAGFLPTTRPLLYGGYLQNRSAGALAAAIVALIPDSMWTAGQITTAGVFTADTEDAQDAGADDFKLFNQAEAGSGHLLSCDVPFGAISYDVTTASVGAAQTHVIEYWNGAWTAIAAAGMLVDIPRSAGQVFAAGEVLVLFDPKTDWIVGGTGVDVPATKYNLRLREPVSSTTAALARRIYLGQVIDSVDALAASGVYPPYNKYAAGMMLPIWTAGLTGAFGTADESNTIELLRS